MGTSDALRHHWEHRKTSLLSKSGFWASWKQPWHEPLLALMCSHGSKWSPTAAVYAQHCRRLKRGYWVSRDPAGRSHACLKRAGKGGWVLTRSDSSGDSWGLYTALGQFSCRHWKPQPWNTGHILPDFSAPTHKHRSVKLFLKKVVSILKPDKQHDFQKQLGSLGWNFPRKFNQVFKVWLSYKLLNMRS